MNFVIYYSVLGRALAMAAVPEPDLDASERVMLAMMDRYVDDWKPYLKWSVDWTSF